MSWFLRWLDWSIKRLLAFLFCIGKLLSSAGQTYFAIRKCVVFLFSTYAEKTPDYFSPWILVPCSIAIIMNLIVTGTNRIPRLWNQMTKESITQDIKDNFKGSAQTYNNLQCSSKTIFWMFTLLGLMSGFAASLSAYFGAVNLFRYLVSLSTKNQDDSENYQATWMQILSLAVGLSSLSSYITYNVFKIAENALYFLGSNKNCNRNCGCCNSICTATTVLTTLNILGTPFLAYFGTSHAIRELNKTLTDTQWSDRDVNIATGYSIPSAMVYGLLTTVPSVYKLLSNWFTKNKSNALLSQNVSNRNSTELTLPMKFFKIIFYIAGTLDSIFSGFGTFISVIKTERDLTTQHDSPESEKRLPPNWILILSIFSGIFSSIANFAFNIWEGWKDFISDKKKKNFSVSLVTPAPVSTSNLNSTAETMVNLNISLSPQNAYHPIPIQQESKSELNKNSQTSFFEISDQGAEPEDFYDRFRHFL